MIHKSTPLLKAKFSPLLQPLAGRFVRTTNRVKTESFFESHPVAGLQGLKRFGHSYAVGRYTEARRDGGVLGEIDEQTRIREGAVDLGKVAFGQETYIPGAYRKDNLVGLLDPAGNHGLQSGNVGNAGCGQAWI